MTQQLKVIDGDGHIFEDSDGIARHFPYSATGARLRSGVFPLNSHIQYSLTRTPPGAFATNAEGRFVNPGPEGWIKFMEEAEIDYAVLFPMSGFDNVATSQSAKTAQLIRIRLNYLF